MKGGWYGSVETEAGRKYRKILVESQSWRPRAKRRSGNTSNRIRVSNGVALVGLGSGMSTREKDLFPSC